MTVNTQEGNSRNASKISESNVSITETCRGLVCSVLLWYLLILLTYFWIFKPGKSMFLSDHLSKSSQEESNENLCEEMSINEIHLLSYLSVSHQKSYEIR